jgi:hypothetical protein
LRAWWTAAVYLSGGRFTLLTVSPVRPEGREARRVPASTKLTAQEKRQLDEIAERRGLTTADVLREGLGLVATLEAVLADLAGREGQLASDWLRASLSPMLAVRAGTHGAGAASGG